MEIPKLIQAVEHSLRFVATAPIPKRGSDIHIWLPYFSCLVAGPITSKVRSATSPVAKYTRMRSFLKFPVLALALVIGCGRVVVAQAKDGTRSADKASRSGFTGAAAEGAITTAANAGQRMDWETQYSEGITIRFTGYIPVM